MKSLAFTLLALLSVTAHAVTQPNIIIFYVDDLGWQDVPLNDVDDPCPCYVSLCQERRSC